jgi:hypothetical protein
MTFSRLGIVQIALVMAVFAVSAGDSTAQVDTGALFARVMTEDGSPLPGVLIQVEAVRGGFTQEGTTGETGAVRFASVPVGAYNVTSTLQGFTSVRHEDVRIGIGQTVSLDVVFKPAVEETVTVVGETPVVDVKKTGTATNFVQDYLDNIPTARDPWVIMEQTAGVDLNTQNVGGSESGNQSSFTARGGAMGNNQWVLDGLNYGDLSSPGASPLYYDFDSFEEVQVSTAGNDPSIPTGGVVINMITKRPGNDIHGNASFYWDSEATQWSNDDKLREVGLTGDRIDKIADYGFDVGGPIKVDKVFGWFAARRNDIRRFRVGDFVDHVVLTDFNAKGIYQWNEHHETTGSFIYGDKSFEGRLFFGPDLQAEETACDQTFPARMYRFEHRATPSDTLFMSAKFGHIYMPFDCPARGGDAQSIFRLNNDYYLEQNGLFVSQYNNGNMANVDFNYFRDDWGGSDHEFKFGFEYKHYHWTSFSNYGGDVALYDVVGSRGGDAGAGTAKLLLNFAPDVTVARTSFYVQDVVRRGPVTMNLGFRFDHQDATNNPVQVPANRLAPDILPSVAFDGNDGGPAWNAISPRLGVSIDLTGDGRTVLRGNYARYYDQMDGRVPFAINPLGAPFGAYVAYTDVDHDGIVTREELDPESELIGFGGAIPFNPQAIVSNFEQARSIQSDLQPPATDEFLVGFEREIAPTLSLKATYVYRKYTKLTDSFVVGVTPDDFTVQIPASASGYNITVFDTPEVPPDVKEFINVPDRSRTYNGVDFTVTKPMRDNWMLISSFNIQNMTQHFDSERAYQDPTNIPFLDGTFYSPTEGRNIFPGTRFGFKLSGMFQLPHEVSLSAYLKISDGNLVPFVTRQPTNFNAITGGNLYNVQPYDDFRLDTLTVVDFRVEKRFNLGGSFSLAAIGDLFNLFNADTTLNVNRRADSASFEDISRILGPRIFRIGVKLRF